MIEELFFQLLRYALHISDQMPGEINPDEWQELYNLSGRQSMLGVTYQAVNRLPAGQRPPLETEMRWMGESERIRSLNRLLNSEAARQTQLFAALNHSTAVLKGQANARLYPDPLMRQPGDIDLYVEGGRREVLALPPCAKVIAEGRGKASYHHLHMPPTAEGVTVEVHFRPSSGNLNPVSNYFLQRWLSREITHTILVPEGFNVPSAPFALAMQLSHIQRHFLAGGIGLRQLCDYYYLLRSSTPAEREAVSCILRRTGLRHSAEAVMWILGHIFQLEETFMLCHPDERRGRRMLADIMQGGNFGQYAPHRQLGLWHGFFYGRLRILRLMSFDFCEVAWIELRYYLHIFSTLPTRIRHKSLSLRNIRSD